MKKRLTREEYAKKMERLMEETNYQLKDGESIVQCHAPYPAYWFVSSLGYVISIHGKTIKLLKANHRYIGKKNADGQRKGQDWYFEYKVDGEEYNRHVTVHRIVAEHFLGLDTEDDSLEVHHIKKKNSFDPTQSEECNRADNLQVLPAEIHKKATKCGNRTQDQIEEKIQNADVDVIEVPDLTEFIVDLINQQGKNVIAYRVNDAKEVKDKTVEVIKVHHAEMIED